MIESETTKKREWTGTFRGVCVPTCYAESEDELLLSVDGFSEDIHDPCWKLLREVFG